MVYTIKSFNKVAVQKTVYYKYALQAKSALTHRYGLEEMTLSGEPFTWVIKTSL